MLLLNVGYVFAAMCFAPHYVTGSLATRWMIGLPTPWLVIATSGGFGINLMSSSFLFGAAAIGAFRLARAVGAKSDPT